MTNSNQRVALVTGGARGIGAATVLRLVSDGFQVVAFDSCAGDGPGYPYSVASRADLDGVVAQCGDRAVGFVGDVRNRADLDRAVAEALERWGRVDVAVAAAGIILGGTPVWEAPTTDLTEQWDVNAVGVWNTAVAALPAMLNGPDVGGARFVAVASAAGSQGLFRLAAYCASKHAVVGIVRGLAADLVGTGAAAIAVSPGSTRTEMLRATARLYDLDDAEQFASGQKLHRLLEPRELADVIAMCCSPSGAALNGSVVSADGGFPA